MLPSNVWGTLFTWNINSYCPKGHSEGIYYCRLIEHIKGCGVHTMIGLSRSRAEPEGGSKQTLLVFNIMAWPALTRLCVQIITVVLS